MESKKQRNHYILFVDDSGSRNPDHKIQDVKKEFDCFALGGVLIHEKDIPFIVERHDNFCKNWNIDYPLHSYSIRNKTRKFAWLEQNDDIRYRFWYDLGEFLVDLPVVSFATVVDRVGYNEKYKDRYQQRWMMCKTAFAVLVERVAKYTKSQNATFEIFFEGSTAKENKMIVSYGKSYKQVGLPFSKDTSSKYTPLSADDFKKILLGKPERGFKSNPLLQVADLYLFPMIARKYYGVGYVPWQAMYANKRVIDALLPEHEWETLGIKYSCFSSTQ